MSTSEWMHLWYEDLPYQSVRLDFLRVSFYSASLSIESWSLSTDSTGSSWSCLSVPEWFCFVTQSFKRDMNRIVPSHSLVNRNNVVHFLRRPRLSSYRSSLMPSVCDRFGISKREEEEAASLTDMERLNDRTDSIGLIFMPFSIDRGFDQGFSCSILRCFLSMTNLILDFDLIEFIAKSLQISVHLAA